MPGNNVQTHECVDLDKAKLMIQSNRLYKIYREKIRSLQPIKQITKPGSLWINLNKKTAMRPEIKA